MSIRTNFLPDGTMAALFYAQVNGLYRDEGLDVTILDGKGSLPTAQDVAAGNVMFGRVGSSSLIQAVGAGADLISVATIRGKNSYGVFTSDDSQLRSIADLKGRSVLVSAGSPETIFLPAALRAAGVDPKDVKQITVDPAAKVSLYASGRGDALVVPIPINVPIVDPKRKSRTLALADAGVPFPDYSLVTTSKTVSENPKTVAAFLRATLKAEQAVREDPEAGVQAVVKARPRVDPKILATQVKLDLDYQCSAGQAGKPYGYNVPAEWDAGTALLKRYGGLPADVDASKLYTNEFFDAPYSVSKQRCP